MQSMSKNTEGIEIINWDSKQLYILGYFSSVALQCLHDGSDHPTSRPEGQASAGGAVPHDDANLVPGAQRCFAA